MIGIIALWVFQAFPATILAQEESGAGGDAGTAAQTSSLEAEWEGTGLLHEDGSPVLAEQGDTAQASGALEALQQNGALSPLADPAPTVPAAYTLTLDLDGGQVNTLQNAGWNQSSAQTYRWLRTLTEGAAGQGITLTPDGTLGGLLPGEPYRAGYLFTGWKIGETVYPTGSTAPVTIHADTTVVAQWQIARYTVDFQANGSQLWSVEVPYGATLWTEPDSPWTAEGLPWDGDTATVSVTMGGMQYSDVTVTRHQQTGDEDQPYYYTFTLDRAFYFTYGGPEPAQAGQHFTSWKLLSGGAGFTVTDNAVFTARFQAEKAYVFNVYFYYEDGTKAGDTVSVACSETEVTEGKLTFSVAVPAIDHYTMVPGTWEGVTWNTDGTVTVEVDTAFGPDNTSATNFLALTVLYEPELIHYTVEYYQQPLHGTDPEKYPMVGKITTSEPVPYGSKIPVEDMPALGVSFDGFLVSAASQSAITEGVVLREGTPNVTFDDNGNATVKVYYDRSSYFIYFQTGTTEVQIDPEKVLYGDNLPDFGAYSEELHRAGYKAVGEGDITLYCLGEGGKLQPWTATDGTMPACDLYAVVSWTPDVTSVRLVYWVESRNAASFQNAYTVTVENVTTESDLTVSLAGGLTIQGDGWPGGTDGETVVAEKFKELMEKRYGSEAYNTFFSYSAENTKKSPGNVANAQATGTGNVTGSGITGDSYKVKVNGDGTTTINIYYTRNLYTLEFVLARVNPQNDNIQIATNTPGTFDNDGWVSTGRDFEDFTFTDFADGVTAGEPQGTEKTYGDLNVERIYRLTAAVGQDTRSAVGRYGTKEIKTQSATYDCYVYTLTARFEANIASLWPTVNNITAVYNNNTNYISMGTDTASYYRNVVTSGTPQHNILNVYSTMDLNVVATGDSKDSWQATPDAGTGAFAHRMIAYWANNAVEYHYYSLYEVLDTRIAYNDSGVKEFDPDKADGNEYDEGQLVWWEDQNKKVRVYVYTTQYSKQYSSFQKSGQNQPSRQGFLSSGKDYAGKDVKEASNIYFFYTRETYTLDIQNVNDRYTVPGELLTTEFDCLSQYDEKKKAKTLQQLGWEQVNADGTVSIRYGGALKPLQEEEITCWLTDTEKGNMEYPLESAGENQYYFWRWYRNTMQTVPIDWEHDNDVSTIASNTTLYAGWFSPRYTTTYVLNGGQWTDTIAYTLTNTEITGAEKIYIYYPHQANDGNAPLYWYIQSKDDRLYVDKLFTCKISDVAHKSSDGDHWVLNENLTLEELQNTSEEDFQGSRLVDQYYCYMGQGIAYSHEYYVNINAAVNTVLPEPQTPTRTGYTFSGWFYFDSVPAGNAAKTYLKEVLTGTQSLASYDEGYVYLNHVGDAFLLHKDENGDLFYYPDQTGYHFSYTNDASVVTRDRQLYAAWKPNGDAKGVVYHLVKQSEADSAGSFTPQGEQESISAEQANTITLGGESYRILRQEELPNLYTGTTYTQTAWQYCTDDAGNKWLPQQASIDLHADERTQTVTGPAQVTAGNTYRVQDENGIYTYYAFFVYEPTNEVVYNVYAIDLSVAVAEGVLDSYQDTFDRSFQVDTTKPYFLHKESKSVPVNDDLTSTVVTENAPAISGYTVYRDWSQALQLQTDTKANNIFFYYVRDDAKIHYSITFYRMTDGRYSAQNAVTIAGIPAVTGEILPLTDMSATYDRLIEMAQACSGYAGSTNEAQNSLYERYKDMTVTLTVGGTDKVFTVQSDDTDTLDLSAIAGYSADYYVDSWSPGGENLVVSDNVVVDVYLASAELVVQKVDTSRLPLAGATFTLERLVETQGGEITHDGKTYTVDPSFTTATAVSGQDGKAIFYNLSARVFADGRGYLYRLTETRAPQGYNCLGEPLYVTTPYTVGDEVSYSVTYTVVNTGIAYLPKTGAFGGVYLVIFLGAGLMAAAVVGSILLLRRRNSPCPSPGKEPPSRDVEPYSPPNDPLKERKTNEK